VRDSQSPIDEGNADILLLFAIRIWRCFSDPISIGKLSSLLFAIRSSRREVSEPNVDGKLTSRFWLKDRFNNFWRHDRPSQLMFSSSTSLAVRSNLFKDLRAAILCGISLIQLLLASNIRTEGPQSQTSSGTAFKSQSCSATTPVNFHRSARLLPTTASGFCVWRSLTFEALVTLVAELLLFLVMGPSYLRVGTEKKVISNT